MNMGRVFLAWILLVSAIILGDIASANPNGSRPLPASAMASVIVNPNAKVLLPNRGAVSGAAGQGNKVRRPIMFGTISRDEWLAKEYFGYLCGEFSYNRCNLHFPYFTFSKITSPNQQLQLTASPMKPRLRSPKSVSKYTKN